jgi:hypothetical protein
LGRGRRGWGGSRTREETSTRLRLKRGTRGGKARESRASFKGMDGQEGGDGLCVVWLAEGLIYIANDPLRKRKSD